MIMVTYVDTTGLCTHNIGVTSGSGVVNFVITSLNKASHLASVMFSNVIRYHD